MQGCFFLTLTHKDLCCLLEHGEFCGNMFINLFTFYTPRLETGLMVSFLLKWQNYCSMENLGIYDMETNVLSYINTHSPNIYWNNLVLLDGKTEIFGKKIYPCLYPWSYWDRQIEKKWSQKFTLKICPRALKVNMTNYRNLCLISNFSS